PSQAARDLLKKVTQEAVLPKWAARCSAQCVKDFNATIGMTLGVTASK
ncbi:MAG: transporter, partial [Achromobacter sp.]